MTVRQAYDGARRTESCPIAGVTRRRALVVLALVGLTGCAELQDPRSTGGERVVSVEGLVCEGARPMVFSPDGAWLLVTAVRETRRGGLPRRELGLFRMGRGEGAWVWPGPADPGSASRVADGRYPRTERACWSDAGTVHFPVGVSASNVRSSGAEPSTGASGFFVRLSQPDELRFGAVPTDCRRPAWSQWRYESPDPTAVPEGFRIDAIPVDGSGPAIRLVAGDGHVVATHALEHSLADQIVLAAYAWSPDRSKLGYLLSENVGSVGRPNRLWVHYRARPRPKALATGVYSIQWRDDRELFGCGRIGGERALSVIRWSFGD